jgi:hypothetical protein
MLSSPAHVRPRGTWSDPHDVGDLVIREVGAIAQVEGRALANRETIDHRPQVFRPWIGRCSLDRSRDQSHSQLGEPAPEAMLVHGQSIDDACDPRPRVVDCRSALELEPEAQVSFLDDVGRVVDREAKSQRHPEVETPFARVVLSNDALGI